MKAKLLPVFGLLLTVVANAGRIEKLPEFKTMTRQQLAEWLTYDHTREFSWDICPAILDSKRMDLVEQSLQNPWTRDKMFNFLQEGPDSDFRDDVILMMLRTNATDLKSWDEIEPIRYEPNKSYVPVTLLDPESSYGKFIKKYLPGLPLEDRLVSTKAMRQHLAEAIKEAKAQPGRVPEITTRLMDYPTADPEYNRGEGRVAVQNKGDPPLPLVGPKTPDERARGEALMAEADAELARQSRAILADKIRRVEEEKAAKLRGIPQQASLNLPLPPVNQSRPHATASSWLLWTGLAAFNTVTLLTLWLANRSLRRREHGI